MRTGALGEHISGQGHEVKKCQNENLLLDGRYLHVPEPVSRQKRETMNLNTFSTSQIGEHLGEKMGKIQESQEIA